MTTVRSAGAEYYRKDGVRITHDPYAPGMAKKYGRRGLRAMSQLMDVYFQAVAAHGLIVASHASLDTGHTARIAGHTDPEGFDPYADTVGPGIYGGTVKRDPQTGDVLIGQQYQNHNPRPGPMYAGGGYTDLVKALQKGEQAIAAILKLDATLVNEVTTGGATPLHMCGMSRKKQHATAYLITRGADINAVDTYGYTPLHRMASNNLPVGAEALLRAGANPNARTRRGETPLSTAISSRAVDVVRILKTYDAQQ